MGSGEPEIVPSLTTQLLYFRQEISIRQPNAASLCEPRCDASGLGQAQAILCAADLRPPSKSIHKFNR